MRPPPPIKPRKFLRLERRVLRFVPHWPEPPAEPPGAREVLEALARAHAPGDRVGLRQIRAAGATGMAAASAVRAWARSVGAWPFRNPTPTRPAGPSDPGPDRAGGDS